MLEHQKTSTVARPDGFSSSHCVFRADTINGERRRAVLVGINDYRGEANDLPSCINDVNAFEKILDKKYGFNQIVRLVDSGATVANVTAALRELFADASPADRLVFFYSGHGSTELRRGEIKQCLVLYDGYFFDEGIVQMTLDLPPGIFTFVADCCFSGGLEKRILAPVSKHSKVVEWARAKSFLHPNRDGFVDDTRAMQDRAVKRFCESTCSRGSVTSASLRVLSTVLEAFMMAPPSHEQLNGVLLSACRENETAAASTASTEGKSAFTYALLHSLQALGLDATLDELVHATQSLIKSTGFAQTPLIKEPKFPIDTRFRSFINFRAPTK
ncbi:caspase domain-containing protein [Rhizobium leguminosarum]|uniref:caspase family protein n=1 Tax=Rhizobium leguminosarum TaxID=384 RepID=UPI001C96816C|nr:caspase family protein [Rhizobium leguminosarum]MBY5701029.1 caspase family protein [Rhizobium leguminosarum]